MDKNLKTHVIIPSTLETIDAAAFNWLDNILDIFVTTNRGWKKVPVILLTAERAFLNKEKKEIRDEDSDALIFPLISIERVGVVKTDAFKRPIPAHIYPERDFKGGVLTLTKKINQTKTNSFAIADSIRKFGQLNFPFKSEKVVYQSITIPLPIYYDISYTINIRTDYQQQMNEIMSSFMVFTGHINTFVLEKNGHIYEAFIDDNYALNNNMSNMGDEEKKYETTVKLKVLGYLIGDDKNQKGPKVTVRENRVQLRFQRDRVIFGDKNEIGKESFKP